MKKCNEVEEQQAEARLKVIKATEVSDVMRIYEHTIYLSFP